LSNFFIKLDVSVVSSASFFRKEKTPILSTPSYSYFQSLGQFDLDVRLKVAIRVNGKAKIVFRNAAETGESWYILD